MILIFLLNLYAKDGNYMLEHKLLYKFQSGFVSGHSTFHQLIELYHKICIALENGQNFHSSAGSVMALYYFSFYK
jgi:hypothetical protein